VAYHKILFSLVVTCMQIRGAPAIASLAALSLAADLSRGLKSEPSPSYLSSLSALQSYVQPHLDFLFTARPTAVNLGAATRRLSRVLNGGVDAGDDPREVAKRLVDEGRLVADEDVGRNREMSRNGAEWLEGVWRGEGAGDEKLNVLTVCNTGSLATSVSYYMRFRKL
jgi:methylthioribose-1-phosphate isomerase